MNYNDNYNGNGKFQESNEHVEFLDSLQLQDISTQGNMSWQFILRNPVINHDYISLDEGLKKNKIVISEVSDDGSVPVLKCVNKSDDNILILSGEEIVGAKQNRIVIISIIVAPNSEVLIPVSCVEQGRWNYESSVFRKGHAAYTDLKRKVMEDVCHSSDLGQGYASDQSRVWNDIQEKESFFNKRSRTGAMNELYEDYTPIFEKVFDNIDVGNACGICIYINGYVAGIDIFPNNKFLLVSYKDTMLGYYLESARYVDNARPYSTFEKAESFIKYLAKIPSKKSKGVSIGDNLNIISHNTVGSGLLHQNEMIHLTAHPRERDVY